jgi:hypothetical protein
LPVACPLRTGTGSAELGTDDVPNHT